jgi:hypothetical protein
LASGVAAAVAGGAENVASGRYAAITGGWRVVASGIGATVGGGGVVSNGAGGWLGHANTASGDASTIPGGFGNTASGDFSVAAGRYSEAAGAHSYALGHRARALNGGAFVWADATDLPFASVADNTFRVRATGGVRLVTAVDIAGNYTESLYVAPSGNVTSSGEVYAVAFNPTSDANAKTAFAPIEASEILQAVVRLPIRTWSFRNGDSGVRHIGPTAQDFRASFGVGGDERTIATVDADGVALAAIQGLHQVMQQKDREIDAMRKQGAVLKREVAELKALVKTLAAKSQ